MRQFAAAVLIVAIGGAIAWSQPRENGRSEPSDSAALMRAKLASTQKIVEGLLEKDFDLVIRGGDELLKIEAHAGWPAEQDQVYSHHRNEMQRQAAKVGQLGRNRNLEGASFAYMHLVSTCIDCHSYCRDVLHVAEEPPALRPAGPMIPDARDPQLSR